MFIGLIYEQNDEGLCVVKVLESENVDKVLNYVKTFMEGVAGRVFEDHGDRGMNHPTTMWENQMAEFCQTTKYKYNIIDLDSSVIEHLT